MSDEQKPSDSADKAADGTFLAWVASHPTATLASKEEARLLDEIVRLRADNAALTAAVQRVRALHNTFPDEKARWCRHCKTQEWPCPTLRALEDATEFDCPMCWRSYQSLTYEDVALCLQRGWCCDYCRAERQVRDSRPHQKEGTP